MDGVPGILAVGDLNFLRGPPGIGQCPQRTITAKQLNSLVILDKYMAPGQHGNGSQFFNQPLPSALLQRARGPQGNPFHAATERVFRILRPLATGDDVIDHANRRGKDHNAEPHCEKDFQE